MPAHEPDDFDLEAHAARFAAAVDAGRIQVPGPDEIRQGAWFSLAGTDDAAVLDPGSFAQGGVLDTLAPGAVLEAVAEAACDPQVLAAMTDNAVLGLVAGSRRLAGRVSAIGVAAVAEYAGRHREPNRKLASHLGFTPFAADDLAPELMVGTTAAEVQMSQALDITGRLPATAAAQWDGQVTDYPVKIIHEATRCLSDADAAEADAILAAAAPTLTPAQLRALAARVVMMIDPQAAEDRRRSAAKSARVERFREYDGTAALCGRDLPPDAVLRSWAHIDAAARDLRKQGAAGTLEQLRAAVYLGLTAAMNPLDMLARILAAADENPVPAGAVHAPTAGAGTRAGTGRQPQPQADTDSQPWPWDEPDEAENQQHTGDTPADRSSADGTDHTNEDGADGDGQNAQDGEDGADEDGQDGRADEDGQDGTDDGGDQGPAGGTRRDDPDPAGPAGGAARDPQAGAVAPFPALITLLVPAGTGFGWSSAPGEIPGYGPLDPRTTRDLMRAASHHPATRWCISVTGADGTAVAHGCAPGQHPWTPPEHGNDPNQRRSGGGERDGPAQARDGKPDPGTTARQRAAEQFIRGLQVKLAPIARGDCDHADYTSNYVVPRSLKHLIKARKATCIAPGCNRAAADGDADHTVPWPEGPTCQHNLGALCRYHHRCKQAPGWKLEQIQPGIFEWHAPSGRIRTTHPTTYLT